MLTVRTAKTLAWAEISKFRRNMKIVNCAFHSRKKQTHLQLECSSPAAAVASRSSPTHTLWVTAWGHGDSHTWSQSQSSGGFPFLLAINVCLPLASYKAKENFLLPKWCILQKSSFLGKLPQYRQKTVGSIWSAQLPWSAPLMLHLSRQQHPSA